MCLMRWSVWKEVFGRYHLAGGKAERGTSLERHRPAAGWLLRALRKFNAFVASGCCGPRTSRAPVEGCLGECAINF
jgi:hypothetical protein